MTKNEQIKISEQWRKLNLEIRTIDRVMKMNGAAGRIFDEEYLQWVSDKKALRDSLTGIVCALPTNIYGL